MNNWSKKLGTSILAASLTAGLFAPAAFAKQPVQENTQTALSAPIDMNIINEERLANALKKQGIIPKKASDKEAAAAVKNYIEKSKVKSLLPICIQKMVIHMQNMILMKSQKTF